MAGIRLQCCGPLLLRLHKSNSLVCCWLQFSLPPPTHTGRPGGGHTIDSSVTCHILPLHKHGIHTSLGRQCCRPSVARDTRFFAHSSLIIELKGILIKLKNIALAISGELFILQLFYVLLLIYKPSNFARAILPYAGG